MCVGEIREQGRVAQGRTSGSCWKRKNEREYGNHKLSGQGVEDRAAGDLGEGSRWWFARGHGGMSWGESWWLAMAGAE